MTKAQFFKKTLPLLFCLFFLKLSLSPAQIEAQESPSNLKASQEITPLDQVAQAAGKASQFGQPNVPTMLAVISMLALLPFAVLLLTSYTKIVIVLSLVRNALGVQQAPPNQVLNGVALLMTIYVMFPTGVAMYNAGKGALEKEAPQSLFTNKTAPYILEVVKDAKEPLRHFLQRNLTKNHQKNFYQLALKSLPKEFRSDLTANDFIVLIPAYITSQIKGAFEIGVLIYLPFFVIDLVTSNILLAMGMMMLSPLTIALPLKLLLIVMTNGWTLIVEGLVLTYR